MGCLQRLGQPKRRGDFAVVGRHSDDYASDEYSTDWQDTAADPRAATQEAEEEEKQ